MTALVILTGGSAGIGRALAETLPFDARLVDVSRSGCELADRHVAADLSDPASWAAVAQAIAEEVPGHDRTVLIHAAGTLDPIGFAADVDGEAYAGNVILNSAAGQVVGQAYVAAVADAPGTHDLVLMSSGAATKPYPGWSAYNAGKAALEHWARSVGGEQAERGGVRVCAVAPGIVATAMQEHIRRQDATDFPQVERFRQLHADGELRDPVTVARQLWQVIEAGVDPGEIIDLRDR